MVPLAGEIDLHIVPVISSSALPTVDHCALTIVSVRNSANRGFSMSVMPVLFVAHGAPMLALDPVKGAELTHWGKALPRPRAILAFSAHWERNEPTLGTLDHTELFYDFSGFPESLYRLRYPAPGAIELARRVSQLIEPSLGPVGQRPERRLDHGIWVPLRWMFPDASIPILQLSLPKGDQPEAAWTLGELLAPLRQEEILIVASGVLVHNLGHLDFREDAPAPAWASEFDLWCARALMDWDTATLRGYRSTAPHVKLAHPTAEHFTPLLIAAGAADAGSHAVHFPITGFEYGSISRRCVQFG